MDKQEDILMENDINKIISDAKLNRTAFSREYGIPLRTLEDWCRKKRTPPDYVLDLLRFRVDYDLGKVKK